MGSLFWDSWADSTDIHALWSQADVRDEWKGRHVVPGSLHVPFMVHGGTAILSKAETRRITEIVISRHFPNRVDPVMVQAVAEVESSLRPFAYRYEARRGEASTGLMQVLQSTAEWLSKDMGYRAYAVDWTSSMLYRPFVAVYFGCAYLCWLSTYKGRKQSEEFIVRGYNGGPSGYSLPSTSVYWEKYRRAKQDLLTHQLFSTQTASASPLPTPLTPPDGWFYWDDVASAADVAELWSHAGVAYEWERGGDKRGGRVRLSRDGNMRPFLTRGELRAVVEIVLNRHFRASGVDAALLCALAEASSGRLLHGRGGPRHPYHGLMQMVPKTAVWLHNDMGYKAVALSSDCCSASPSFLWQPFVSVYFGAAYVKWLGHYSGQKRGEEFVVRAYVVGPSGLEKGTPSSDDFWQSYLEAKKQRW